MLSVYDSFGPKPGRIFSVRFGGVGVTDTWKESFKVSSEQLVAAVGTLLHEGNVRRADTK